MTNPMDIAFTPAVKAQQEKYGSRERYDQLAETRPWQSIITPELRDTIAQQNSFYLGTASAGGQPYVQHRGGEKGFLKVLDERTLGFADLEGNRQYITTGNLSENARVILFLMDYEHAHRIKIWGEARVVENDAALLAKLQSGQPKKPAQRGILISVSAWNGNCRQHIPRKMDVDTVEALFAEKEARIEQLELQLAKAATQ